METDSLSRLNHAANILLVVLALLTLVLGAHLYVSMVMLGNTGPHFPEQSNNCEVEW